MWWRSTGERERADLTYYCTSHRSSRRLSDFDQWSVNELEFTFRWSINHQFSDWKYVQLGSCVYKYVGDRVLDWIGYDRRQVFSLLNQPASYDPRLSINNNPPRCASKQYCAHLLVSTYRLHLCSTVVVVVDAGGWCLITTGRRDWDLAGSGEC